MGNDYANPPLPSANPRIYDIDHNGKNEFFIGQGTIQLEPLSRGPFFVTGVAAHWFGGVGVITITGYDSNNNIVSIADNLVGQQGIFENIMLFDPDIWYITIRGVETALDKICFYR